MNEQPINAELSDLAQLTDWFEDIVKAVQVI
jgi:hypothetical protein